MCLHFWKKGYSRIATSFPPLPPSFPSLTRCSYSHLSPVMPGAGRAMPPPTPLFFFTPLPPLPPPSPLPPHSPPAVRGGMGGTPPLRVFRYALDDLRLFSALEAAGVAGCVVVVDTVRQRADG